jgi:hypothetical protein
MEHFHSDDVFGEIGLAASELGFADVTQERTQLLGAREGSAGNRPI